jgi:hypothetical protein
MATLIGSDITIEDAFDGHYESPEPLFTSGEAYGSGSRSELQEGSPPVEDYVQRTREWISRRLGTKLGAHARGYWRFQQQVRGSYISGHSPLYAALRFARAIAGEEVRTLSVRRFSEKDDQLFLPVGIPAEAWEEEATTGREVKQAIYLAPSMGSTLNGNAEWPSCPGRLFRPTGAWKLVRLR